MLARREVYCEVQHQRQRSSLLLELWWLRVVNKSEVFIIGWTLLDMDIKDKISKGDVIGVG